jgi:hypothetical protein
MRREAHIGDSLSRLRNNRKFYLENKQIIYGLVVHLHTWFDEFAFKNLSDNPTEAELLKHREKRHHHEGIEECVELLSSQYGEKFRDVAEQEAIMHVKRDMGYIPDKAKYNGDYFWEKWIANRDGAYRGP